MITHAWPAWGPSFIFLGACALIIILQLFQGGYRPDPRETHDFIEEKLSQFNRSKQKQPSAKH